MPTECKALVLDKPNAGFQLRDIVLGDILPTELIVKVVACGICQTDLTAEAGKIGSVLPGIFGHEAGGIITEVGSEVTGFEVGDSVLMSFGHCGDCKTCNEGHLSTCQTYVERNILGIRANGKSSIGHQKSDGTLLTGQWFGQSSFSEYCIVTPNACVKVPTGTNLRLLAPLGCGIQTAFNTVINVIRPTPEDTIAVWGLGTVGCSAVLAAKHLGVKTIIALDLHENRLNLAKEFGATHVINAKSEDIVAQIAAITGGKMLDFTVEASGSEDSYTLALQSLGRQGTHAQIGILPFIPRIQNTTMAIFQIKTLFVVNGDAIPREFIPKLMKFVETGELPLEKLVTYFPLAEHKAAVEGMRNGSVIKGVLTFD